jgi:hypothetical protein
MPPQFISCHERMTFKELFNITQPEYALEYPDEYLIFLTKFDTNDLTAEIMVILINNCQ